MENVQPTSYGSLSVPETSDPQGEYQPADGGYQSQSGYLPQPEQQPQPEESIQIGYPSQAGYQPLPGYADQSGVPPQLENPSSTRSSDEPSEPNQYGWFADIRHNMRQLYSLAAATFIFASGGMSFAEAVGFGDVMAIETKLFQISWFIAVIIGAIISTLLVEKLTKRMFNLISSTLVIVNGVLLVACSGSAPAMVSARYCDGIAFGLSLIPAIVAGSEQSVKRFRGLVLSAEHIGLTFGVIVRIIFGNFWEYSWSLNLNQMHGILALIFGMAALLCTFILTIESPIFYLRKDNEVEAIVSLHRLRKSDIVNTETYSLLYENRHLLNEDVVRGRAENISFGIVPMIKVCTFRVLVSMSFSLPLTGGLFIISLLNGTDSSLYTYAVARMVGVVITAFTIDILGRRLFSALSLLLGGGFMITLGFLFSNSFQLEKFSQILLMLQFYQLFAGIAAPASTCYMGEAFAVSVKPCFILVSVIFENIIQIIVCCTFEGGNESVSSYVYTLGAFQAMFAIAFFVVMPETKQTTLREALANFKTPLHIGIANR